MTGMSQRVGLQEDVEGDVFGRCPFPRIHTHLLFTSSRHVLKQCCFAPVRADNRRGWAECNATGWAETAESSGGQHLARSGETGWHRIQKAETAKPSLFRSLFCLGCHPRHASTWKEMSLKENSVHKLFIFIQYAVIICHFIIEIKQVSGYNSVSREPLHKHHDFLLFLMCTIPYIFLLTVSNTVHKYSTHILVSIRLCTVFFPACTGSLNLNHRHWICPCFKRKWRTSTFRRMSSTLPPPVLANV